MAITEITRRNRGLLFALTFMLSGTTHAQTALGSTFHLGVYADANQNDFVHQSATFADQHYGSLNPFSHSLSVTDQDTAGSVLTVTSSASAAWTSAADGVVLWRGMGWFHNTHVSSGAKLNGFVLDGPVWSYTFRATTDSLFTMHYDVRASGDHFGLLGAVIQWNGPGGNLDLTNSYTPVANGTFTRAVTSGNTYTVGLFNMGNIFTSSIPNYGPGLMDADFNWNIRAVPEPSMVTAVGLGSGLLLMRRRRTG